MIIPMYGENKWFNNDSKLFSIKTYAKCNSFLKQMLQELEIEPVTVSGGPLATNIALVQQVKTMLNKSDRYKLVEISSILDPDEKFPDKQTGARTRARLAKKLNSITESAVDSGHDLPTLGIMIDDVSPNAFKQSLAVVLENYFDAGKTDIISARELFRQILDDLQARDIVRRKINVVASNFPGMYGYLQEAYEDESGVSAYGRGKNLKTAKVRIGWTLT
jgi:hypothetical protein